MQRNLFLISGTLTSSVGFSLLFAWWFGIPLDMNETAKIAGFTLTFAGLLLSNVGLRNDSA